MKEKKQRSISKLFAYAGNYKYLAIASWVLAALSALIALVIRRCAQTLEKYMTLPNVWQVENNCFAIYLDVDTTELSVQLREIRSEIYTFVCLWSVFTNNSQKISTHLLTVLINRCIT